jgi:hypothetical protein
MHLQAGSVNTFLGEHLGQYYPLHFWLDPASRRLMVKSMGVRIV